MEFDPNRPIWLQLVAEFARRIVLGHWGAGEKLPGVRELAAELRVNPNTVQRALAELDRLSLTRTERAAGRFVTEDAAAIDAARRELATEAARSYVSQAQGLGMGLSAARELLTQEWAVFMKEGAR